MDEQPDILLCEDCGELIEDGEACYLFGLGAERALCLDCAVKRGGAWSEDAGRWEASPRIDDLSP